MKTIEKILEEFDKKFFQDKTGERVDGYLAMNTHREYCKIAVHDEVKQFISNSIKEILEELKMEKHTDKFGGEARCRYNDAVDEINSKIDKILNR